MAGTPRTEQRPAASEGPTIEPVDVRVYKFTGWQGIVKIPESWCRECDMFVRTVDQAVERVHAPVEVQVLPWILYLFGALRYGGYHPPVLVIDGQRIAQGEDVPSIERVADAIEAAAEARRSQGEA